MQKLGQELRPPHPTLEAASTVMDQIESLRGHLVAKRFEAVASETPHQFHETISDTVITDALGIYLVAQWFGHGSPMEVVKRGEMTFPALLHGKERLVYVSVMEKIQQYRKCYLMVPGKDRNLSGSIGVLVARSVRNPGTFHVLGYTVSVGGWCGARERRYPRRRRPVWSIREDEMSSMDQLEPHRVGGSLELTV